MGTKKNPRSGYKVDNGGSCGCACHDFLDVCVAYRVEREVVPTMHRVYFKYTHLNVLIDQGPIAHEKLAEFAMDTVGESKNNYVYMHRFLEMEENGVPGDPDAIIFHYRVEEFFVGTLEDTGQHEVASCGFLDGDVSHLVADSSPADVLPFQIFAKVSDPFGRTKSVTVDDVYYDTAISSLEFMILEKQRSTFPSRDALDEFAKAERASRTLRLSCGRQQLDPSKVVSDYPSISPEANITCLCTGPGGGEIDELPATAAGPSDAGGGAPSAALPTGAAQLAAVASPADPFIEQKRRAHGRLAQTVSDAAIRAESAAASARTAASASDPAGATAKAAEAADASTSALAAAVQLRRALEKTSTNDSAHAGLAAMCVAADAAAGRARLAADGATLMAANVAAPLRCARAGSLVHSFPY